MTWKIRSAGESQYSLQNHFTSKTIAAKASEAEKPARVIQVPLGKKADEQPAWQFAKQKDGTYKIVDSKTGKALTALAGNSSSEVMIVLEASNESDAQKWELIETDPATLTM
jgi:hypothetical protein